MTKEKKDLEGFRVWQIQSNMTPKEIMSGKKDELNKLDELNNPDNWNNTYAIRIGRLGLK